jgi:hypothetical protein
VLGLDGKKLVAGDVAGAFAAPLANFFVGDEAARGGVQVAAVDTDGDGRADLVTQPGDVAWTRVFRGRDFTGPGEPAHFQDLDPLDPIAVDPPPAS